MSQWRASQAAAILYVAAERITIVVGSSWMAPPAPELSSAAHAHARIPETNRRSAICALTGGKNRGFLRLSGNDPAPSNLPPCAPAGGQGRRRGGRVVKLKVDVRPIAAPSAAVPASWEVVISNDRDGETITRSLEVAWAGKQRYPLPPSDDRAAWLSDVAHLYDPEAPADAAKLDAAFRQIVSGLEPLEKVVRPFGRYLFETLLGSRGWRMLRNVVGQEDVEVALSWPSGEVDFNRFPWEMMRSPSRFLAEEPRLAITRRVAGSRARLDRVATPPKVLFVVGTEPFDPSIRAGAEFIGILRGLRAQNVGLNMMWHLVTNATHESLTAALKGFRPSVVHFICHGGFDLLSGSSCLQLRSPDPAEPSRPLTASDLGKMLDELGAPGPEIVVLNACHSADLPFEHRARAGQLSTPLAAELVQRGVPIVVAMAGHVSDQACRLFSRRFYETLLAGGRIAQATAQGRRSGIIDGGAIKPDASVDWALPTVFFSETIDDPLVDASVMEAERQWNEIADEYPCDKASAFCGRLEALRLFDALMAAPEMQVSVWRQKAGFQVLAVQAPDHNDPQDPEWQFGRSRFLREVAALAVRRGHVPCLVSRESWENGEVPRTPAALQKVLRRAVETTAERFRLDDWSWVAVDALDGLARSGVGPIAQIPDGLPDELVKALNRSERRPDHPRVTAVALRLDLLVLLEQARARRAVEPQATKLVLLIDDVHRMDEAARVLIQEILGDAGVRRAREHIRVVLTYEATASPGPGTTFNDVIRPWVDNTAWVEPVDFGRFRKPIEEELAVRHYLLADLANPLTLFHDDYQLVQMFLDDAASKIKGVPSNLRPKMKDLVETYIRYPYESMRVLRRANDEDQLQRLASAEGRVSL